MASASALDFTYRYPFASALESDARGSRLRLATCTREAEHPYFFQGAVRDPRIFADLLIGLSDVVRANYFMPANLSLLDPILTSNEELLRLEGFSGCCGAYARVDLPADAFDAELRGRGTTNVDFNAPMRTALTRVRPDEDVRLAVGRDEVALSRAGDTTVERKVKLPLRWIKGLGELQPYQRGLQLRHELPAADALRFLRELPRTPSKRPAWVEATGRSARLSRRERSGAVRINGTHRLRVLEALAARASQLRIWYDGGSASSGWEIVFPRARFFLLVSPEVFRGFSGEGQNLSALADPGWQDVLARVRAALQWQSKLDAGPLADRLGVPIEQVEGALAALGARGLVGYDVNTGAYYHRELPFDLSRVDALQPRLRDARTLLEERKVRILGEVDGGWDAAVAGTDVTHHVRLRPSGDRCSCPWFAKHLGERGPCKHVLAARILAEGDGDPTA
jgi:hypothetical protein